MDALRVRLKKTRDRREQEILCKFKSCYTMSDIKHYAKHDPDSIKTKLSALAKPTYIDYTTEKMVAQHEVYSTSSLLTSLFCVYDLEIVRGGYMGRDIELALDAAINWAYVNGEINLLSTISKEFTELSLKVSRLELCLAREDRESSHVACEVEEDLLHEFFVASMYTNNLRKLVPNYQVYFLGIKSRTPTRINSISDTKLQECQAICPCDTSQTIDYVLIENLSGYGYKTATMTDALKSCSSEDFLSWIIQLVLALEMGVVHFGFTHNNLNPDNITICYKYGTRKESLRYFHNNACYIMKTSSVAVMTNFDTSHVKHKMKVESIDDLTTNRSEHFGPVGFDALGIFHNETRPFYDIYRITMWSLRILQCTNFEVFKEVRSISKFFGFTYDRDLKKALDKEESLSYTYSTTISELERTKSLKEFLNLMFEQFPQKMNSIMMLDFDYPNPLDRFSVRDIMDRYAGLKKRKDELKKLQVKHCRIDDVDSEDLICEPTTTELEQAVAEFEGFVKLVNRNKLETVEKAKKELTIIMAEIEFESGKLDSIADEGEKSRSGVNLIRKIEIANRMSSDIELFVNKFN